MILHNPNNNSSYLDGRIYAFWLKFKSDILRISKSGWKEEDYKGATFCQYKVMQYYGVLYLLIAIYIDVQRTKQTWDYYVTKYDLNTKRKCLACNGIDLDKALAIFDFPLSTCTGGIECMGVGIDFIVEPTSIPTSTLTTVNILDLINNPSTCNSVVSTDCPVTPCTIES